ncbi:Glycine-zipper containing OmpA-like membrane domain-containing protein [Propionivibrio dicarboxylicus]|uniref:Glycine-zipper containing OmpA-like membrane domain-containing protein n=2 Tax=Propionivibrio dicarboxylicus TaxID=83767 RepID=A0A1G7ZJ83_9RHOO|nr:Glycine-zipper containing OmpA-like membrane domain-containing protein [Propionivibrio dicarboxylicus]
MSANRKRMGLAAAVAALLLAGCATVPTGPSIMALPGSGKTFDQFRGDDAECRQYAQLQIGGNTGTEVDPGVRNAAIGTLVGALAGAAFGGHQGAGAGAGAGLLVGSMSGADAAQQSNQTAQRRYDNAYVQCMYAKGQQVPVSGNMARMQMQAPSLSVPASVTPAAPMAAPYPPPPPPPGS